MLERPKALLANQLGGVGGVDEEGAVVSGAAEVVGASDLFPLVFLGPLNVTSRTDPMT